MRLARQLALVCFAAMVASPRVVKAAGTSCQLVNVTPLVFPPYHAGQSQPDDGQGELALQCSATTMVQITMTRGISGRLAPRRMASALASVAYDIFQDAARTAIWGDGTAGSQVYLVMVMMGQTLHLPIYARVFPLQAAPSGNYSDQIEVVVNF